MARILVVDRDLARRSQLRSRLTDLRLEVEVAAEFEDVGSDSHFDVGLFHVADLVQAEAPPPAVRALIAYSSNPDDDRFGAAALDRGAILFLPSDQLGSVERVIESRLRTQLLTSRLGERQRVALLENRSLRGAARSSAGAGGARNGQTRGSGSSEGVLLLDAELRVAYLGGGAAALLGRDVLGRSLDEVFPDSDMGALVASARRATHECLRVDLPARASGSPGRSLAIAVHPLGGRARWLLFLTDLGLRPLLEEVLRRSETAVPAAATSALLDAASEVFRLDSTRYVDTPTRAVRSEFPARAQSNEPLLVRGERGTGRGHVARALHYQSPSRGKLLEIGCVGRSPGALETELFGHPLASRSRGQGLVHGSRGGTLLVRDIDRLPLPCQERLLTAVSARGGPRLIATTTWPAGAMVDGDQFHAELGRRLEANVLTLSPLRANLDRLSSLADAISRRHGADGVGPDVLEILALHDWPGNLIELVDVLSGAARSAGEATIRFVDLPSGFLGSGGDRQEGSPVVGDGGPAPEWVVTEEDPVSFEVYERKAILRALNHCSGDRMAAARLLGIGKSTIYRKIRELGIDPTAPTTG